jgi:ATP-dependent RNA helicase DeaD
VTVEPQAPSFRELGLSEPVLQALAAVGYESPSPIQAQTIPVLLTGADVLGQAQTGTGKTAAFALPVLQQIDLKHMAPQALVLVPTRELAIQVSEAFAKYAAHLKGFHVLPIYGGQSYTPQLKGLKRGAHVIVGTPGRVMDHIKSNALDLGSLRFLVLDEGDEMLQMGFVDDIEWILEQTPAERQIALFSATMPPAIRRIAQKHMREPQQITIQNKASTAPKIRQRMWLVSGMHKLDALTRVLEVERFDAMLVFVRTKLETNDLAERLEARGFSAAALNGDIPQQQRERTIARLKNGQLDIVIATDVAARGLDVERISHVVNYDIPYDSETYVHRIGRTGRAGRSGEAILFVAPRERNMLRIIERVTKTRIEPMTLPTVEDVNEQRVLKFKERITSALPSEEARAFRPLLERMENEQNVPAIEIAAALAALLQGSTPFLLPKKAEGADAGAPRSWTPEPRRRRDADAPSRAAREPRESRHTERGDANPRGKRREHSEHFEGGERAELSEQHHARERGEHTQRSEHSGERGERSQRSEHSGERADLTERSEQLDAGDRSELTQRTEHSEAGEHGEGAEHERRPRRDRRGAESHDDGPPMETFRIEVGHTHGVLPGNIVGAIANEAGLDGKFIGHIDIREDHSFVDLPEGMPKEIFRELKKVRVRGAELRITRVDSKPPRAESEGRHTRRPRPDSDDRPAVGPRPGEGHQGDRPRHTEGHNSSRPRFQSDRPKRKGSGPHTRGRRF